MGRHRGRSVVGCLAVAVAVAAGLVAGPPGIASAADDAPQVSRIDGADRFAVSAAISASGYEPGAPVAYVASGRVFADALAAGPVAAFLGGPILLTDTDSIPEVVRTELTRLEPQRIVVVGGRASVSSAVRAALGAYTTGEVTRVAGADRYRTAYLVSKGVFSASDTLPQYLVSGAIFTDALSAGPAAGIANAPIFLVTPSGGGGFSLDHENPAIIVGGPDSVPTSVDDPCPSWSGCERIGGADRFEVSANVSKATFESGLDRVYVASGRVFPDALSGVPLAASWGAPILLVDTDRLPAAVADEIRRLAPKEIVVLGGPATVSDAVLAELAAL